MNSAVALFRKLSFMRMLAPFWGLGGIFFLLGFAVHRLTPKALESFAMGLSAWQWAVLALWTAFMGIAEGYRGFQKRFSPRTAARARHLRDRPSPVRAVLAPFFCMGYFHARRRLQISSIALTTAIVAIIVAVSFCPQPWRGIIDFGVVVGLTWGIASLAVFAWKALSAADYPYSPETPEAFKTSGFKESTANQ